MGQWMGTPHHMLYIESIIPPREPAEAVNYELASGWFVPSQGWSVNVWRQALSLLRLVAVTVGNIDRAANPATGTPSWTASEGEWSSLLECQNRDVLACKVDELRPEQLLTVKLDLSAIITKGAALLCRLNPSERVSSNSLWSPASGRDAWLDFLPNSFFFFFF